MTSGMQHHCATVLLKHSGCDSDHFIHTSLLHEHHKKVLGKRIICIAVQISKNQLTKHVSHSGRHSEHHKPCLAMPALRQDTTRADAEFESTYWHMFLLLKPANRFEQDSGRPYMYVAAIWSWCEQTSISHDRLKLFATRHSQLYHWFCHCRHHDAVCHAYSCT